MDWCSDSLLDEVSLFREVLSSVETNPSRRGSSSLSQADEQQTVSTTSAHFKKPTCRSVAGNSNQDQSHDQNRIGRLFVTSLIAESRGAYDEET